MSKRKEAQGREEFVRNDYNGSRNQRYTKPSRNLTWTRDPLARNHTTRFPTAVDPAVSSSGIVPSARHSHSYGPHESPQYGLGAVYPQNDYGAHGAPSHAHGTHFHPSPGFQAHYPHKSRGRYPPSHGSRDYYSHSHGSRDYYPPYHGSRDYYPTSHGSRDYYPPSHGTREYYPHSHVSSPHHPIQRVGASGPQPYSHGPAAASHPPHSKGVHGFTSHEAGDIVPFPKFPAVSVRGLPRNCTEVDIVQFFDGLDIVDVFLVFINKIFSRKAFVIFPNAAAVGFALQRDKQKFSDTFVDISTCRRHEYYDAVAAAVNDGIDFGSTLEVKDKNVVDVNYHEGPHSQAARFKDSSLVRSIDTVADVKLHRHTDVQPGNLLDRDQGKPPRHIIKVRAGPCPVEKKVILGIFGECNLSEDRIHVVFNPDGKPTGEMLLEFISQEDVKKAMSMDKTVMESHLIEIVSCLEDSQITNTKQTQERESQETTKDSYDKELMGPDAQSHSNPRSYNDREQKVYSQILKLRNVPPSADLYDIIDFFSEFRLTLERLHVVCRRDGIATGEVYVEFDSVEDAKKAISKDKRKILTQCVELFPSSPNEASQAMSRSW